MMNTIMGYGSDPDSDDFNDEISEWNSIHSDFSTCSSCESVDACQILGQCAKKW